MPGCLVPAINRLITARFFFRCSVWPTFWGRKYNNHFAPEGRNLPGSLLLLLPPFVWYLTQSWFAARNRDSRKRFVGICDWWVAWATVGQVEMQEVLLLLFIVYSKIFWTPQNIGRHFFCTLLKLLYSSISFYMTYECVCMYIDSSHLAWHQ